MYNQKNEVKKKLSNSKTQTKNSTNKLLLVKSFT